MHRTIMCNNTLAVDICVQNPANQDSSPSYVHSFGTGERVEGTLVIVSQNNLSFENLHISFNGEQRTSIPSSTPDQAHHHFLKLVQLIDDAALPSPKVFKSGQRYDVPFSFEVPDYLPPSSCHHSANPLVKAAHLQPPPSCGDASVAGFGGKLRDDFAPAGCRVVYSIDMKLERPSVTSGLQEIVMEKRLKVRIKPAVGDTPLPDLPIESLSNDYSPYQEEAIHDGKPKALAGRLAITLEQPECFYLPLRDPIKLISKAIRLFMVFIPSDNSPMLPPRELKSLRAQITATTTYTTNINGPQPPTKEKDFFNRPINYRDAEVVLSIPSVPNLHWTQNETGSYTAALLVPVTLPKDKSFIATFHSCLISRIYTISLQIGVNGTSSMFRLRAPMQIAAERDPAALPSYNASLGIIEEGW